MLVITVCKRIHKQLLGRLGQKLALLSVVSLLIQFRLTRYEAVPFKDHLVGEAKSYGFHHFTIEPVYIFGLSRLCNHCVVFRNNMDINLNCFGFKISFEVRLQHFKLRPDIQIFNVEG